MYIYEQYMYIYKGGKEAISGSPPVLLEEFSSRKIILYLLFLLKPWFLYKMVAQNTMRTFGVISVIWPE